MARLKLSLVILLVAIFLLPYGNLYSARRGKKRSPVISYVDVYGGAGYSNLLHNIAGTKTPGGGAAILGVGYDLKHRKNPFIMHAGLEFMFLNSTTRINPFMSEATFAYNDPYHNNYIIDYYLNFDKYREAHNRFSVNVPILVGAQFDRWYFLVGAKAGLALVGTYNMSSTLTTTAVDPELIDPFENMPNHSFLSSDIKNNGALKYGLDVTGSVEAGVVLDEWMPRNALKLRNRNRTKLSYRVGLFADYGVLNINANKTSDMLLAFPDMKQNPDGSYAMDAAKLHEVKPNSLLASETAANTKLNSLVVGAKFTVLFQVSKDPVKRKRPKPKPKPKPKPQVPLPDPPFLYLSVRDFDTEKPIDANVKVFKTEAPFDTVFVAKTNIETGMTQTRMKSNKYGITVSRPGYIEYTDTLFGIYNDTVYIELQPIKENTIVILENLLFDFDKATLQNDSTQSLIDLEKLMKENPSIEIEITGHTDNVGSKSYNKKLSERRAKTVYDLMVTRGIDPKRMSWKGMGSAEPIETNDTDEGRAINRRVEFRIIYIDESAPLENSDTESTLVEEESIDESN